MIATPRPWTIDILEGGGWAVVTDADSDGAKVIAELDDAVGDRGANATLIIAAVNDYDFHRAVLTALGELADEWDKRYATGHVNWGAPADELRSVLNPSRYEVEP